MICADTGSFTAFLQGEQGSDVDLIADAMRQRALVFAPATLAELLSDPTLPASLEALILRIPTLEISSGYWERAGRLRATLMRRRFPPKLADSLIAQSCLDYQIPLVTRDQDFSPFQKLAGLRVVSLVPRVQ